MSWHHLLALLTHLPLATGIPLRVWGTTNSACAWESLTSTSATIILSFSPWHPPRHKLGGRGGNIYILGTTCK